jgi:hypothetical protein
MTVMERDFSKGMSGIDKSGNDLHYSDFVAQRIIALVSIGILIKRKSMSHEEEKHVAWHFDESQYTREQLSRKANNGQQELQHVAAEPLPVFSSLFATHVIFARR